MSDTQNESAPNEQDQAAADAALEAAADAPLFALDGDPPEPTLTREGDRTDPLDGAWPVRDEIGLQQEPPGDEALELFGEPGGEGARRQLDSLEHDERMRAERMGRTVPIDKHVETHVGERGSASGGGKSQPADGDQALGQPLGPLDPLARLPERDSIFVIDGEDVRLGDILDQHQIAQRGIAAARACL